LDAIRALLARYCELIDAGDFDGVGALFSHGTLSDPRGTVFAEGAEAVAAFYRNSVKLHDGSPRTRHLVTGTVCESQDDGSVVARSVYVVLQNLDGEPRPIVAGRYVDSFVTDGDGWRFADRRFFVDLSGDLSDHLASRT
jgi:3-phenylpropionate/cinnamic acid dioxygenase small subunit